MTIKTWQARAKSSFRVDLERAMLEEITELRAKSDMDDAMLAGNGALIAELRAKLDQALEDALNFEGRAYKAEAKLAELESQEPVAYWVPKAEQFCIPSKDGRPFAKAWEPLYAAPGAKP